MVSTLTHIHSRILYAPREIIVMTRAAAAAQGKKNVNRTFFKSKTLVRNEIRHTLGGCCCCCLSPPTTTTTTIVGLFSAPELMERVRERV